MKMTTTTQHAERYGSLASRPRPVDGSAAPVSVGTAYQAVAMHRLGTCGDMAGFAIDATVATAKPTRRFGTSPQ